jgi:hypothetical protein
VGDPRIQFNLGTPTKKNKYQKIVSRAITQNSFNTTRLHSVASPGRS